MPTEKQECVKQKKKNADEDNSSIEDDLDDSDVLDPNNPKVGVIETADINSDDNDIDDDNDTPKGLDSDLGPYWMLAQSAQAYVLGTIKSYSNIEASKSTPQYGFNRGLK
jgi:hypothetical protein